MRNSNPISVILVLAGSAEAEAAPVPKLTEEEMVSKLKSDFR